MDWTKLIETLLAAMGGNYIDKQNAKQSVSGLDALTGSEAKGIYGTQNRTADMASLLQNTMSGTNQNPQLAGAMQNLQARATAPVTPPQINQTMRNQATAPNPLMNTVMQTAQNPAGKQMRSQGMQMLFDRLAQRMGTRQMGTGTLTPLGK